MQTKTTMGYQFRPIRMGVMKKTENKCWWCCGEKGTLIHSWWECKMLQPLSFIFWKSYWPLLLYCKWVLSLQLLSSIFLFLQVRGGQVTVGKSRSFISRWPGRRDVVWVTGPLNDWPGGFQIFDYLTLWYPARSFSWYFGQFRCTPKVFTFLA